MRTRTAVVVVALAVVAVGGRANAVSSSGGPDYQGALRCTSGTWEAIGDSGHQPTGIGAITSNGSTLTVNHVHVAQVGSVQANGDADYMRHGITVPGASGGLDYDRLEFFKGGVRISPEAACDLAYTNVWITGFAGQ